MYYITRIELHNVNGNIEYPRLHRAMELRGFKRSFSVRGSALELPTAEYILTDSISIEDVLGKARAAVSAVGNSAGILVSHVVEGLFDNLDAA